MRYVRFLKPAKVHLEQCRLDALVTITSDLGETFFSEDAEVTASLSNAGCVVSSKVFQWTSDMRCLPIKWQLPKGFSSWPAVLSMGIKQNEDQNIVRWSPPAILPAESAPLDPRRGVETAERLVERHFSSPTGELYFIWEETGESIARHLWYIKTQ